MKPKKIYPPIYSAFGAFVDTLNGKISRLWRGCNKSYKVNKVKDIGPIQLSGTPLRGGTLK